MLVFLKYSFQENKTNTKHVRNYIFHRASYLPYTEIHTCSDGTQLTTVLHSRLEAVTCVKMFDVILFPVKAGTGTDVILTSGKPSPLDDERRSIHPSILFKKTKQIQNMSEIIYFIEHAASLIPRYTLVLIEGN